MELSNFKIYAPRKAKRMAGIPKARMIFLLAFFPNKNNLKELFRKWTIAVRIIAISMGKNNPKMGSNRVPKPKPENSVKADPISAIIQITT